MSSELLLPVLLLGPSDEHRSMTSPGHPTVVVHVHLVEKEGVPLIKVRKEYILRLRRYHYFFLLCAETKGNCGF